MPRTPDPELRRRWRELLATFDSQRDTVGEFCNRHGISTASFYNWRKRLAELQSAPAIIPVEVVREAGDDPKAVVVRIGRHVEIEIQAGHAHLAADVATALARIQIEPHSTSDRQVVS
jgi:hypothetical protein